MQVSNLAWSKAPITSSVSGDGNISAEKIDHEKSILYVTFQFETYGTLLHATCWVLHTKEKNDDKNA